MTQIANCWNECDPLKRVILGRPEGTNFPAAEPTFEYKNKISLSVTPRQGTSWISMNTFSIDPKTVCVQAGETAYCEQLDKLGFEVIQIPYEKVVPFGGGLHCTTLDIYREGTLEDYFPEQIEGY